MQVRELHPWNVMPEQARRIQVELALKVQKGPTLELARVKTIAGLDVSSTKEDPMLTAGVVVCDAQTLEVLETAEAQVPATFPYIPGLLSFRETPALLEALKKLRTEPDVLLIDGHGLAHPRRFGIACHIGLIVDKPTIGCAKSLLIGKPVCPPKLADLSTVAPTGAKVEGERRWEPGSAVPLVDSQEQVGVALRTKDGAAPVYISIGHKIDLPSATEIVLNCVRGYRLPKPARLAHLHVNAIRISTRNAHQSTSPCSP